MSPAAQRPGPYWPDDPMELASICLDALRQSGDVRAVMADLVAGRQAYSGLRCRLARTFELGLAARLLFGRRS